MSAARFGGTLTVRLPKEVLRRLRARAKAAGSTPSELVRMLLERELLAQHPEEGPALLERTSR